MKLHYTYLLMNQDAMVEYVGESIDPQSRFYNHTKAKPGFSGMGYFYGREDLTLVIDSAHLDRKEALQREGELKLKYGLEWSEKNRNQNNGRKAVESGHMDRMVTKESCSKGGKVAGKIVGARIHTCPYCGKTGKSNLMLRWHFDNCKKKDH